MRDDIDFDFIDSYIGEHADDFQLDIENPTIRFSFDLALESLKEHEIDRCVWTLKKAVELSIDGKQILYIIITLLIDTELYSEAIEVLSEAAEKFFEDKAQTAWWRGYCLFSTDRLDEAEEMFAANLVGDFNESSVASLNMLSLIRSKQDRFMEVKAFTQEVISWKIRLGDLDSIASDYESLMLCCEKLNLVDEAINAAKAGQLVSPTHTDWSAEILRLENLSSLKDEFKTCEEWLKAGSFWHTDIPKDFFYGTSEFFDNLFHCDAIWSDPKFYLFNFLINDEGLEESLARVESLSDYIHLQPTWPVYLETPDISIVMTLNRDYLLAWVGIGLQGLLVGVNIKTWDIYHADDADARFATGAVLNWFLDCSLNNLKHEMFVSKAHSWLEVDRPWEPDLTTWSTTRVFHEDIENIRQSVDRKPPQAHRVRGHIRTLTERQPTDEARENAPAYIRRNMGPTDTFVRSYTKSRTHETGKLLVHLNTKSSLADFLGTATQRE